MFCKHSLVAFEMGREWDSARHWNVFQRIEKCAEDWCSFRSRGLHVLKRDFQAQFQSSCCSTGGTSTGVVHSSMEFMAKHAARYFSTLCQKLPTWMYFTANISYCWKLEALEVHILRQLQRMQVEQFIRERDMLRQVAPHWDFLWNMEFGISMFTALLVPWMPTKRPVASWCSSFLGFVCAEAGISKSNTLAIESGWVRYERRILLLRNAFHHGFEIGRYRRKAEKLMFWPFLNPFWLHW